MVAGTGVGLGDSVGLGDGDGDVSGDGEVEGDGDAAAAWRLKVAQGFGATLAHSLWTPGVSPANGMTLVVKLPLASAFDAPATWLIASQ
jgi:hypothetical protein